MKLTENLIKKECVANAVDQLLDEGLQRDRQTLINDILLCHYMQRTSKEIEGELDVTTDIAEFIADVLRAFLIP